MTAAAFGAALLAVEAHGLLKRYGRRVVVDGISIGVRWGEIVGTLGPNGAGKTTTLEILEGYRSVDAGTTRVLGLDPWLDGPKLRPRIGLMLQEGGVQPQARPRELLRLYARFWADPRDPDDLLGTVGLEAVAQTPWRRLSGGERQRLSLGLALVGRPELLILDEPTAGMDPEAKATTRSLILAERTAGTTVLLTTHELADLERLADRIVIIAAGHVVAEGTPSELLAGATPRLRLRLERPLTDDEQTSLGTHVARPVIAAAEPATYELGGPPPDPPLVAAIAAWCEAAGVLVVAIGSSGGTLEERYLELVAGAVDVEAQETEADDAESPDVEAAP